jgi:hypothetical protein
MSKVKTTRPKSAQHRTKQPSATSPPERFFQKELGEEAPSFQTMQALFVRAIALQARAPWNEMEEDNLVVVGHPVTKQVLYASVMGAAGEARAVQVYIGLESYFWFLKVHSQIPATLGDYLANQNSVFVSFTNPGELAPHDRLLAKSMKHPLTPGIEAPQFRTIRPGYHPWFITDSEAQTLAAGLEGVLVACEARSKNPDLDLWSQEDVYPFVQFNRQSGEQSLYSLTSVAAPVETPRMPVPPDLDQRRIQKALDQSYPSSGTLEVDHFYNAASIGGKYERKACMRIALAIDAKTMMAFPPLVSAPEDSTGNMLQQVILGAMEAQLAIPAEIHVRDREFKILLAPLAEKLGFDIKVRDVLPGLDFARGEIEAMLMAMRD